MANDLPNPVPVPTVQALVDSHAQPGKDPQSNLAFTGFMAESGDRAMLIASRCVLLWQMFVPIAWISHNFIYVHRFKEASMLVASGICLMLWNVYHVGTAISKFSWDANQENAKIVTPQKKFIILAGQAVLALYCTHLAKNQNPEGMKLWFWMTLPAFAVLMLDFRKMLLTVLLGIAIGTAHDWYFLGYKWGINWFLAQSTINTFIVICMIAATFAARERRQVVQIAKQLNAANQLLEAQADQIAMLAVAQERNRLAREIHDSVGHSLTVVGAQLDAATALLTQDPERAMVALQRARQSSQEGLAEIRRSVSALRSHALDGHALSDALSRLISTFERPGVRIALNQTGEIRQLPALVEMTLYRCAQEGLTNACRHAEANEIDLQLDFTSSANVRLSVLDNGKGFKAASSEGHGLKGLRERAALLHGSFRAGTGPHEGGLCEIIIPA